MTTRRTLVRALGASALLAGVGHARGQPQPKIPRIGMLVLGVAEDAYSKCAIAVFRQRLAELDYVEGKTILIGPTSTWCWPRWAARRTSQTHLP